MYVNHSLRFQLTWMLLILLLSVCGISAPAGPSADAAYFTSAISEEASHGSTPADTVYSAETERAGTLPMKNGFITEQIDTVLQLEIPGNEHFNRLGIYNYHGSGNILFDDVSILNWILEKTK